MRIGLRNFLFKIKVAEADRCSCDEGSQTPNHIVPAVYHSAHEAVGAAVGHWYSGDELRQDRIKPAGHSLGGQLYAPNRSPPAVSVYNT